MKIAFIGHPGSGKTYAATTLAGRIGTQAIDIDDLLHNWVYFVFKKPYRKALTRLLNDKTAWIIDGYAGKRMPVSVWNEADRIVYINLPKSALRHNVYRRYRLTKTSGEAVHGQELFANVVKNLWQIYVLDYSLRQCVRGIRRSVNASKLIEVRSRRELHNLVDGLADTL